MSECVGCLTKKKYLEVSEARVRELEDVIQEWFGVYPCKHEAETYSSHPECTYCYVVRKMDETLSDKSNQSDKEK